MRIGYKVVPYDLDTGKIVNLDIAVDYHDADAPFVKVFKKSIQSIAKINLSKAAYRLLLYLLGEVKWDNFFYYNRQKLAKQLQLQPTAISAAFKELLVSEILVVLDSQKFLGIVNPEYSFCGTDIKHVKKLFYRKVLDNEKMDSEESTKSRVSNDNHTTESAESQDLKEKLQKSEKHGTNQRQKLLDYLKAKANENRVVYKLVKDIVKETGVSKRVVIEFLKFLEEHELISRPKRGEIYLSEELVV